MKLPERRWPGLRARTLFGLLALIVTSAMILTSTNVYSTGDDDDGDVVCVSNNGTNSPGCFKTRSDEKLELLIYGNGEHVFQPPEVCGTVVTTPDIAPVECARPDGTVVMYTVGRSDNCDLEVDVVEAQETAFIRGDANEDSYVNIGDAIYLLTGLFYQAGLNNLPGCLDALDVNDDGDPDISDVIYALCYLFFGDDAPPAPFYPFCDCDPTDDIYGCESFKPCH